jgi:hypothetical protein
MSTFSPPSTSMKYEVPIKIVRKLKHHCPTYMETLSEELTGEFNLASPPLKIATCAPPVHVIPYNDDD